jgi:hypothetical protein
MILNNNAVKIDSNVEPTKALNFGISDVRLVVDILSKLYAYPIRTLVQEYICNGRDAMREANTWGKQPIDITVPNTLDPVFKVRDYGVGITPDRMENIFVNYGSSTKRNTNAQTGGFGIGAKSAFSYTDSFTITSFVNGIKYIYVAHLADDGGVNLINKESTKESNGVEISIGVKPKDIPEFRNAVQRCVRFWQEPIKFIGSKDIHQLIPTLTLGNMTVYNSHGNESRTIYLIDGIEYDLMKEEGNYRGYNFNYRRDIELHSGNSIVTLKVNNGHFKIASSRERLENNDQNKAYQDKMLSDCRSKIEGIINSRINNASLPLKQRLEHKKTYSCFDQIARLDLDLGSNYKMTKEAVVCPAPVQYRYVRRGRRASFHFELNASTRLDFNVVAYTSNDNSNTLARKLNHYLETNKDKVLVSADAIANIPFQDIIFTNRLNADSLPLPPKKTAQRTQKSTRDAICWKVESSGTRSQWTVEKLNNQAAPVVIVDEITPESIELAPFLLVINVPKCNKDLVLKKGMTVDEGKKYLLSKNKEDVVGLDSLPYGWEKVNVLKKFKRRKSDDAMQRYLFAQFPTLKAERDSMLKEFTDLVRKYPLITVLNSLGHYSTNSTQIVIDEINKQSKEK